MVRRSMFGTLAIYFRGKLVVCLADKEEPWNGLLVATERAHHDTLMADFSALAPHAIVTKWLYVSESHENFEPTANCVIERIQLGDPRLGIIPRPKKSRKRRL